jgi:hypothetical protein
MYYCHCVEKQWKSKKRDGFFKPIKLHIVISITLSIACLQSVIINLTYESGFFLPAAPGSC